jgi:tRNA-Thr(GGU) m(6)t(6)A37 methyltransferase TsaA
MTKRIDPFDGDRLPDLAVRTIGVVRTPFHERFGIPRQPGLVPDARGRLELLTPWNRPEAVAGLEGFSHLWLLFWFHGNPDTEPGLTVRPPRLGGNVRVGVFASRSPFRPNPIGLSAVALERIEQGEAGTVLHLRGVDLLDGTPVLDVKPYVPYADALADAQGGFAAEAIERLPVTFSAAARSALVHRVDAGEVERVITAVLSLDPRPGYRRDGPDSDRVLGMKLYDFDLRWRVVGGAVEVLDLAPPEMMGPPSA